VKEKKRSERGEKEIRIKDKVMNKEILVAKSLSHLITWFQCGFGTGWLLISLKLRKVRRKNYA